MSIIKVDYGELAEGGGDLSVIAEFTATNAYSVPYDTGYTIDQVRAISVTSSPAGARYFGIREENALTDLEATSVSVTIDSSTKHIICKSTYQNITTLYIKLCN